MGKLFDSEYYFICKIRDERRPEMTPDEDTAELDYDSEQMPIGSKPLIFHNGSLDWQKANKVEPIDPPPDFLFDGSNVLVKNELREILLPLEIPDLAIQPAIYIDHKNQWHENYWYLTFLELFDCWDRSLSEFYPDDDDEYPMHEVTRYSLNDELLQKTLLKDRLLFKMGGTSIGLIVAHHSVSKYFVGSGAVCVPIAEYGVTYP